MRSHARLPPAISQLLLKGKGVQPSPAAHLGGAFCRFVSVHKGRHISLLPAQHALLVNRNRPAKACGAGARAGRMGCRPAFIHARRSAAARSVATGISSFCSDRPGYCSRQGRTGSQWATAAYPLHARETPSCGAHARQMTGCRRAPAGAAGSCALPGRRLAACRTMGSGQRAVTASSHRAHPAGSGAKPDGHQNGFASDPLNPNNTTCARTCTRGWLPLAPPAAAG